MYCGQTVGWINMPLGTEVCLGPGHIVLDGDPAPPNGKGHSSPHFRNLWTQPRLLRTGRRQSLRLYKPRPISIVAKRWDESGCHLVWRYASAQEDRAPPGKGHRSPPPLFCPCLLWPNGRPPQLLLSSCILVLDCCIFLSLIYCTAQAQA